VQSVHYSPNNLLLLKAREALGAAGAVELRRERAVERPPDAFRSFSKKSGRIPQARNVHWARMVSQMQTSS
jgi:hypothetical protein